MGQQTNGPHVVWFDDGKRPNVADVLEQSDDVAMHRLDFAGEARANWAVMESAHVYCITSTRDEVPDEYKADEQLIERCPNLLVVSTSGAGYDPVNVAACPAAGILVVNHAGSRERRSRAGTPKARRSAWSAWETPGAVWRGSAAWG